MFLIAASAFIPAWGQPAPAASFAPSSPFAVPFSGSWLAEQNRLVDPAAVAGAQTVDLQGLRFDGLRLDLQVRKAVLAPRQPILRYTLAAAQREWLRSITADGPRRMSLSGAFDAGSARGLSFAFSRQHSGKASYADNRLAFARNGLEAGLRIRDVGQGYARSSLVSDAEWNDVKDLLGWRQTDLNLAWKGTPGLNLSAAMSRGRNGSSGDNRSARSLGLDWKPSAGTAISFQSDMTANSGRGGRNRTGTQRLALKQSLGQFGFDLSQETLVNVKGRSGRTRHFGFETPKDAFAAFRADFTDARINGRAIREQRYALQTREKAPLWLGLSHVQSRDGDRDNTVSALRFRARTTSGLSLEGDMSLADNDGKDRRDAGLRLDWTPAKDWRLQGQMRQVTGAPQTMADLHLTGKPDKATKVEARLLRPTDPKNPYRRQNSVRVERRLSASANMTAEMTALESKTGPAADIARLHLDAKVLSGQLTGSYRSGGRALVPDQTEIAYTGTLDKKSPLRLTARYKQTDGAPTTETLSASWTVRKGFTLSGSYADNPEDDKGRIQEQTVYTMGMGLDIRPGLSLSIAYADETRKSFRSRRTDVAIKGRLNRLTEIDLAVTARAATGLPEDPAYRVSVRHEVDRDHRFALLVDRKTRAVHGKDDLTASLELVTDF